VVFQTLLVLWFLLTIKIFIHSFTSDVSGRSKFVSKTSCLLEFDNFVSQ